MFKRLFIILLLLVLGFVGYGTYKTLKTPEDLYIFTEVFAGCPERPSCVSSRATDDLHRVAALGYTGDPATAFVLLREVVERMGGVIEHERPDYIHAVFYVSDLKLRDDVELLMSDDGQVNVRSISRFAWRDKGLNRARVEEIRRAFEAMP